MGEKIRLNKLISDSGYCSRREADQYIEQGRVQVNRLVCDTKGTLARLTDRIEVDGELIRHEVRRIYIALNKPAGITCTTNLSDQTNIVDFIGHKERIFHIGRLDKPSEGLIFMTNDGNIVNKILRAGNSHEKEYIVTVDKPITEEFLQQMRSGVWIQRRVRTLPCPVTRESGSSFRITLVQGLNRQIRRMCESLGYNVRRLIRIRIMNITLEGLSNGEWRYFTPKEIDHMNDMIEVSRNSKSAAKQRKKSSQDSDSQKPPIGVVKSKRSDRKPDTNTKSADKTSRKRSDSTTPLNESRDSHKSSGSQEKGGKDTRRTSASSSRASTSEKQNKSRVSSGGTDTSKKQSRGKASISSSGATAAKKQSRVKDRASTSSGGANTAKKQSRVKDRASTSSGRGASTKFTEYRKSGTTRPKPTQK